MSNIESVKQKILQLDAGSFQNLCDAYLCRIGYPNIVSLGGEAGTRKTTFGTPDAYFYTADGKYIFVEYTTKKAGLAAKIEEDLQKCLDTSKTGISHDMISEIIYCHTSSNITAKQDHTIRTMCADVGIRLTVIGIDKLAEDLYLFYPGIARDFLGISMTTDQILLPDDFVKGYNAARMAAPLNYPFLFRDHEMKKIEEAFRTENIVVLSGAAGVGKTRLALHYANKIDKDAFVNGCGLILAKAEYSPLMVKLYFELLFNPYHNTPRELLTKFEEHFELLEDIYCTMLSCDINFDYNGVFLSVICRERPSVAERYTDYLADRKAGSFREGQRRNRCFWNLENCVEIYNRMFDRLLERIQFPGFSVPYFLESILLPVEGEKILEKKRSEWIGQCIQRQADDRLKMYCLFAVIAKCKPETKREYVRLFLENNDSFEDFQEIPLIPVSWSHTGSAVPVYSGWIDYLESLLPEFVGLKWIEHKKYVEAEIRHLKKQIEDEEIREILRG